MDVSGEDELDLADPLLHRLRLRLAPLVVLLEVVREVPIEVEPSGVVPALPSLTSALAGNFEAIRVHAWHHVDPGVVQQPPRTYNINVMLCLQSHSNPYSVL